MKWPISSKPWLTPMRYRGTAWDAWFGDAANIKNAVFHEVLELAA